MQNNNTGSFQSNVMQQGSNSKTYPIFDLLWNFMIQQESQTFNLPSQEEGAGFLQYAIQTTESEAIVSLKGGRGGRGGKGKGTGKIGGSVFDDNGESENTKDVKIDNNQDTGSFGKQGETGGDSQARSTASGCNAIIIIMFVAFSCLCIHINRPAYTLLL